MRMGNGAARGDQGQNDDFGERGRGVIKRHDRSDFT
jgi:hypothetical protein